MATSTKKTLTADIATITQLQGDLNKRMAAITKARGTRNGVEFLQYVLVIHYGIANDIRARKKNCASFSQTMIDAGRTKNNAATMVGACFNKKIKRLAADVPLEKLAQHLADNDLDSVTKLIGYSAKDPDKVAALLERVAKLDDAQQADFFAGIDAMRAG